MRHVALPLGLLLMALPLLWATEANAGRRRAESPERKHCEKFEPVHDERKLTTEECLRALSEAEPPEHREGCRTCHVALAATEASEPGGAEVRVHVEVDVGPLHRDVVPEAGGPWDTLDRPTWEARIEGPGAEGIGPAEVAIDEAEGFGCTVRNRRLRGALVVGCSHPGGALRQGVQTVGTLRFDRPAEPVSVRPSKLYYTTENADECEETRRPIALATRWSDRGIGYYARDCRIQDREDEGASPVEAFDFLDAEIAGSP